MKLNSFNKFSFLVFAIFGSCILGNPSSHAGGWNGGGDGRAWEADAAWYLTVEGVPAPIRYCIEISSRFQLSRAKSSAIVKRSFKRWFDYINERQVNADLIRERKNILTTSAIEKSSCDGTEDLRMAFGTTSNSIEQEKKRYFDPLAFALSGRATRDHTDPRGNWYGNGFIWFASNRTGANTSNEYFELETEVLVMHELGHIFGNGYVAGTVMDQNIVRFLNDFRNGHYYKFKDPKRDLQTLSRLREIDGSRDLLMCLHPNCKKQTYFDVIISESKINEMAELFDVRASDFPSTTKADLTIEGDTRMADAIQSGIILTLKSGNKSLKVDLGRPSSVVHVPIQTNVFRVMGFRGSMVRNNDDSRYQVAEVMIFERQLSGHPVTLRILRNVTGRLHVLFQDNRYDADNVLISLDEPAYRVF